mmetsp:Transcript_27667/g.65702  ORF Transcript_27667/g.65702 Transcript_27667/m.65702 type:complete len:441 (-) Transcript_27667:229-1551(-)
MDTNMFSDSDEENDPIMGMPSPENKPSRGGAVPQMGRTGHGIHNALGAPFGSVSGGMKKKVFSMVDLSSAMDAEEDQPAAGQKKTRAATSAKDDPYGIGADSDDDEDQPKLAHTAGSVKQGLRKVMSNLDFAAMSSPMDFAPSPTHQPRPLNQNVLIVFDMDHTMVGDLVSLSDRDNIETNVPWTYWPEGVSKGLSPEFIIPYLQRGMLRPGLLELLNFLRTIGATIIVYTHSEEKWAAKVCEAMERVAGWKFITHLFSRTDCKDGHPEFTARKSLQHVRNELARIHDMHWPTEENTVMFDDDGNALPKSEASRLVKVASYDYWEPCQWDEVVNEPMMARNPPDLADMVRRSVVEWGIAPPSYGKAVTNHEDAKRDARWAAQLHQKRQILLSYNKVARLDRVMHDLDEAFRGDLSNLEALPERIRVILGKSVQPQSRRRT